MPKYIGIALFLLLAGCDEDKCTRYVASSVNYQAAFGYCMDKGATISKSGTHDNSYDTIHECESYAWHMDSAQCREQKP